MFANDNILPKRCLRSPLSKTRCYLVFHDVHWENSLLHGKLLRSCTTSKKKGVPSVSRATLYSLVGDLI